MIWAISILLIGHFVADFVMQSDTMAMNKSKSWRWLSAHVLVYSCGLLAAAVLILSPIAALFYVAGNAVLHFITDAITSRLTAYLYAKAERHWFFVAIGFDQLVHALTLIWTLEWVMA